jgi:predicted Zn-dependent protease
MTPEQRLEAFRQFVAKSPHDPFARYSLAMQLRAMGRADEAAAELQECVRHSPDYVPAYLILGQLLEADGEGGKAARVYEDGLAIAARAHNDHARNELGKALDALRARGELA